MSSVAIFLLGAFSVRIAGKALEPLRSKSAAALLIVLAAESRPLRREWLIELLWPEMPAGAGRKHLRQTLYDLRQAIAEFEAATPHPFILADRQTVQLNESLAYQVDTAQFADLIATGERESLRRAVDLYRGDFLADFYLPDSSAFEDWAAAKRALFHRLALDAMDRLAQYDLQQVHYERAAGLARRQLELDSLRETAVQQLMIALALGGRRNEALAQYEASRAELSRELGVDPEQATQAVHERILSGDLLPAGSDEVLALLQPVHDAAAAPDASAQIPQEETVNNLPAEPTPFVGRAQELQKLTDQLIDPSYRLVTLLGPGGSGKSRLAVQAARRLLNEQPDSFPDGIWYAPLTGPSDAGQLASALIDGLPFRAFDLESDLRSQLLAYLEGRKMLLVLDNMEYALAPEGGQFLAELLDRAPGVTLLAGSRTRLNLHSEQLFPLAGLDVPQESAIPEESAGDYSALQLFANSARRVRPDFLLNAETIPPVLAICRQLQGMPLAIELAAAWVEVMSPSEVAAEVDRCLDFLETDLVDIPERQRSLRAVFEASWRLLNGQERALFLRLSVFRGGFDYAAARQVADASHRTLLGLLNKSWLQRDESGRYLAHEMLRQYAYQRLSDDEMARESAHERHSVYFAELIQAQGELLRGPQQFEAMDRIDRNLDNVTITWEWLVERARFETAIESMLPGLFLYFAARMRGQRLVSLVDSAYRQLLEGSEVPRPDWQVRLLIAKAAFPGDFLITRFFVEDLYAPTGGEIVATAYEIARQNGIEDQLGLWSVVLSMLVGWTHDRARAIEWLHHLVEAYRAQEDIWLLAFALENLGGLMMPSGMGRPGGHAGTAEADRYLAEASALFDTLGDRREKGYSMRLWGLVRRGWDYDEGERILLAARNDMMAAGDLLVETEINDALAAVSLSKEEVAESFAYMQRARQGYKKLGTRHFEAGTLGWEALWALRVDTLDHARKARQESLDIARLVDDKIIQAWGIWELGDVERVAGNYALARSLFEEARVLFAAMTDPFGQAFYERAMGDLAQDLGNYQEAQQRFEESLRLARKHSHQWLVVYTLFGLARAESALAHGNDNDQAQKHVLEGLRSAEYHRYWDLFGIGLAGLAACYAANGQPEEALHLLRIVLAWPLTWQETRRQARDLQERILTDQPGLANDLDLGDGDLPEIRALVPDLLARFDPEQDK